MVRYAYLWTHEAEAGAEEGRKDRPCAVVLAVVRAAPPGARIFTADPDGDVQLGRAGRARMMTRAITAR